MFSLAPVQFRDSPIEGRGVFARRRFEPGDVIVGYAPKQRRLDVSDPELSTAPDEHLHVTSEGYWVIVPDTSEPGGWLCNHSCRPNAAIHSDGAGRIQCIRRIDPGQEVTVFYGWVRINTTEPDTCRCGSARCRGAISFDLLEADAEECDQDTVHGRAFRARLEAYASYLRTIDHENVLETIDRKLRFMREAARKRASPSER